MENQPEAPTLARRVLDLDLPTGDVLLGYIAGHFAASDTLTAERLAVYVDDSIAVSK